MQSIQKSECNVVQLNVFVWSLPELAKKDKPVHAILIDYIKLLLVNSTPLIFRELATARPLPELPPSPSPPPPVDLVHQLQNELVLKNMFYLKHQLHLSKVIGEGKEMAMCGVYRILPIHVYYM